MFQVQYKVLYTLDLCANQHTLIAICSYFMFWQIGTISFVHFCIWLGPTDS